MTVAGCEDHPTGARIAGALPATPEAAQNLACAAGAPFAR